MATSPSETMPPSFEELLQAAGWLTIPGIVAHLEAAGYWLRHPELASRRHRERHVERHLQNIRGPRGLPVFLRARRQGSNELEYIHPLSATAEDIRREGRYFLVESTKRRRSLHRIADNDRPTMTLRSDGRLVILPAEDASADDVARISALLDHLRAPDTEAHGELDPPGVLSERQRSRIECGELSYLEEVAQQEQQSVPAHRRTAEAMRVLAQVQAAAEYLGLSGSEDVVSRAYEAELFAS